MNKKKTHLVRFPKEEAKGAGQGGKAGRRNVAVVRVVFRGMAWIVFLLCFGGYGRLMAQSDTIADQRIDEVVVVARMPAVEMGAGRTTYHLQSSVTRSQGSLYDAFRATPGVSIRSDGTIYLNGQSGVEVRIDGKQTYLSGKDLTNLLKSMPASAVDKIDLITHPSARQDAAGSSGIIDIRTRKIKLRGLNLSLNGNFSHGRYPEGSGSASANYRQDKLNFFATYSYVQGRSFDRLKIGRTFTDAVTEAPTGIRLYQYSLRRNCQTSHFYRAGIDYALSSRTTMGVVASGTYYGRNLRGDMDARFSSPVSASDSTLFTYNRVHKKTSNQTVGVNLVHAFDSAGKSLDASFDYLFYDYKENQGRNTRFLTDCPEPPRRDTLRGDIDGKLELYSGQINLRLPAFGGSAVEAGAKTTWVKLDNAARYADARGSSWIPNARLSNRYVYEENIHAGYLQWRGKFRSVQAEIGFRVENTRVEGRQSGNSLQPDSSFRQRYTHLFPTVQLQYDWGRGSWSFFYGRRIGRPNYGDLNPFMYLFDNYTYDRGNPYLKPQVSDEIEAAYIREEVGKLELFYVRIKDVIVRNFYLEDGNRVIASSGNFPSAYRTGARLHTVPLSFAEHGSVNFSASAVYHRYHWRTDDREEENNRLSFLASCNPQFTFRKGWTVELNLSYQSRMAAGQSTFLPLFQADAGLQKTVARGRGSIRLYVRDLFFSCRQDMDVQAPMQFAAVRERSDRTVVGISLSYRLNSGFELKNLRRKNEIDESKRINL